MDKNDTHEFANYWEITHGFRYKLDQHWLPYVELQWLDRWNDYHREQYRLRLGLRYAF